MSKQKALLLLLSGISTFIAMKLGPILAQFGQITFIIALAIVLIILTNLANNIAVVFILLMLVCIPIVLLGIGA